MRYNLYFSVFCFASYGLFTQEPSLKTDSYPYIENSVSSSPSFTSQGQHVTFSIDYLLWKTGFSESVYSAKSSSSAVQIANLKTLHPDSSSGIRVGGSYEFTHIGFCLSATWSHLENEAKNSETLRASEQFLLVQASRFDPFLASDSDTLQPEQSGSWNFKYNQVDLALSRGFHVTKYYRLDPEIGVRFLQLNGQFNVFNNNASNFDFNNIYQKNFYRGAGAYLALENHFYLTERFFLMAFGGAGVVYGKQRLKLFSQQSTLSSSNVYGLKLRENVWDLLPLLDVGMHIAWQNTFDEEKYALKLKLGYEYHAILDGYVNLTLPTSGGTEDILEFKKSAIYLHGLIASFSFGF